MIELQALISVDNSLLDEILQAAANQKRIDIVERVLNLYPDVEKQAIAQNLLPYVVIYNPLAEIEKFCEASGAQIEYQYPDEENILHRVAKIVHDTWPPANPEAIRW